MSLKTFLFRESPRPIPELPDLTEEVEGLLLTLGRNAEKPRATIEGTLRTLRFFAKENRKATLVAIATLVLHDPGVDIFKISLKSEHEPRWPNWIARGAAVACIFLDASELIGILSRALAIHPEETEELSLALDWVLMPNEQRQKIQNPFRCLIA